MSLNLSLLVSLPKNILRINIRNMPLIPRNSLLNKPLGQILIDLIFGLTSSPQLIPDIPLQLESILQTSDPLNRLVLNKLRIDKILLIRAHKPLVMILPSHLNVISDLTESLSVKILGFNLGNVAGIPWDMTLPVMGHAFGLIANLVFGYKSRVARNNVFIFLLSDHFKFNEFYNGKASLLIFRLGQVQQRRPVRFQSRRSRSGLGAGSVKRRQAVWFSKG
jgi:hypothetical protein